MRAPTSLFYLVMFTLACNVHLLFPGKTCNQARMSLSCKGRAYLLVDTRPLYAWFAYTANYGDGTLSVLTVDLVTEKLVAEAKWWNYAGSSCPRGSHLHKTVVCGPQSTYLGCQLRVVYSGKETPHPLLRVGAQDTWNFNLGGTL